MGNWEDGDRLWSKPGKGWAAAEKAAEEVHSVATALPAGAPDGHQHGLGAGTRPSAIAAPGFAENDAEANGELGTPVRRIDAGYFQKRQQVVAVFPQVLGQALVRRVGLGRPERIKQPARQSA